MVPGQTPYTDVPISNIRGVIAKRLCLSKQVRILCKRSNESILLTVSNAIIIVTVPKERYVNFAKKVAIFNRGVNETGNL